jgi:hypothetical protein
MDRGESKQSAVCGSTEENDGILSEQNLASILWSNILDITAFLHIDFDGMHPF